MSTSINGLQSLVNSHIEAESSVQNSKGRIASSPNLQGQLNGIKVAPRVTLEERNFAQKVLSHIKGFSLTAKEALLLSKNVKVATKAEIDQLKSKPHKSSHRQQVKRGSRLTADATKAEKTGSLNKAYMQAALWRAESTENLVVAGLRNHSQLNLADAKVLLEAANRHQSALDLPTERAPERPGSHSNDLPSYDSLFGEDG